MVRNSLGASLIGKRQNLKSASTTTTTTTLSSQQQQLLQRLQNIPPDQVQFATVLHEIVLRMQQLKVDVSKAPRDLPQKLAQVVRAYVNNTNQSPILHVAVQLLSYNVVLLLLALYPQDVNIRDKLINWTPFHLAADYGDNGQICILLARCGADVNAITENGETALHIACEHGNNQLVRVLVVTLSVQVNVASKQSKETPLMLAVRECSAETVQLLIDHGAEVNASDSDGTTPLVAALFRGELDIIRVLLKNCADLCVQDSDGCTPLHHACGDGDLEIVKVLVQALQDRGIDICEYLCTGVKNTGFTAVDLAYQEGHQDIIDYMSQFT